MRFIHRYLFWCSLIIFRFVPADVSAKKLRHILKDKISTGEVDIGTLIAPQTFEKTSVKNSDVVTVEVQIEGRKIKLFNIRKKMLGNQKTYMWLHTDNEINNMDRHVLMQLLQKRKYLSQEAGKEHTITHLKEKLKKYERTRYLMFWHDGWTFSKHSNMTMASCMYDDVAFLKMMNLRHKMAIE